MPVSKSLKALRVSYYCTERGWSSSKWMSQCREYCEWGALEETQVSDSPGGGVDGALGATGAMRPTVAAHPIGEVSVTEARACPTGVSELDRALDGGIVSGAVTLLIGEPGVGKSTLLLGAAMRTAVATHECRDGPILYVTGEELVSQVQLRAERIDAPDPGLLLAAGTKLSALLRHVEAAGSSLLVVDLAQTTASAQVEDSAGGVTQVRVVAGALIAVAKRCNTPVSLVGHVTRDGGIVGLRVLKHLIGVITQFEGDRHARLRLLQAIKNRHGPADEVGCSDPDERGIVGLVNSSGLLLSAARSEVPDACATVTLEGRRPIPVEIQVLVTPVNAGSPRRTTSGVNHSRTAMTLAVLSAQPRVDTSSADIYASTVGGARAVEPAADLAMAISVVLVACNLSTPAGLAAFGGVGLVGEARATVDIRWRLAEVFRLGFDQAIVSLAGSAGLREVAGMQALPVVHMGEAMGAALPRG